MLDLIIGIVIGLFCGVFFIALCSAGSDLRDEIKERREEEKDGESK